MESAFKIGTIVVANSGPPGLIDAKGVVLGPAGSSGMLTVAFRNCTTGHDGVWAYPSRQGKRNDCWFIFPENLVKVVPPPVTADLRLKPQAKTVLRHLKKHGHISPAKAAVVYGITRLAASIFEIRKVGYDVTTSINEDEQGHKYALYTLAKAH